MAPRTQPPSAAPNTISFDEVTFTWKHMGGMILITLSIGLYVGGIRKEIDSNTDISKAKLECDAKVTAAKEKYDDCKMELLKATTMPLENVVRRNLNK